MLCSQRILKAKDDTYYESQCHFNLYNDALLSVNIEMNEIADLQWHL